MKFNRKFIFRLRSDNAILRRFVCSVLRKNTDKCESGSESCDTCEDKYVDRSISRPELAEVFGVTESVINNWESGRTEIGIEDLLFYCQIAPVELTDILVFHK